MTQTMDAGIWMPTRRNLIGGLLMVLVAWVFRNRSPYQAGKWFKGGQLFAAAAYSLGHGGNDAQKTIGIIWLLMITAGTATTDVKTLPMWVVYACYGAIQDLESLQAEERFPKMWEEKDPSVAMAMTQSAPLPVPARIEASAFATVA